MNIEEYKKHTLNGSTFVETTEAAVSKTTPATATYAQVGEDYPAQFAGDGTASLWKVTVKPGTDTVETVSVRINGNKEPKEPLSRGTAFSGGGDIVFGVVLNKGVDNIAVNTFEVLVNGVPVD